MTEIGVRFLTLIQQMQALGSPRSYPAGDRFAAGGLIRWEGVLSLRIRLLRPAVFLAGTFLRIVFLDAVLLAVTFLRVVLLRVALLRVVFFAFDSREAVFVPAATFLAAGWCLTVELLIVGDIPIHLIRVSAVRGPTPRPRNGSEPGPRSRSLPHPPASSTTTQ